MNMHNLILKFRQWLICVLLYMDMKEDLKQKPMTLMSVHYPMYKEICFTVYPKKIED